MRPAARRARQASPLHATRFSWSRRIGVAAALLLLIGAGITLAAGTLTGERADPGRSAKPTAATSGTAPALIAPGAFTTLAEIELEAQIPQSLVAEARRIRVYVNGDLARERSLEGQPTIVIGGIPLSEGANEIRATLTGGGGEGPLSAPVTVTRDTKEPLIHVSRPEPGATVYVDVVTLRGRTEAGATVAVTDEVSGGDVPATVEDDGSFEALLPLEMGQNAFVLTSEDAAGNRASTRYVLTRALSLGTVDLTLSATELDYRDLPARLDLVAAIRDEHGVASTGAPVVFSLSPPNRSTGTYETTTSNGHARWQGMVVAGDERAIGTWLVTVLVTLPSGEELRGDASFVVR